MRGFEIVLGLVVLATLVAAFAQRLRAPAPSLLVIVGVAVGALPGVPPVQLSPELVALGVLPPLLYAGAADVAVRELRSVLRSVAALAVGLVAASAVAIALVTHILFDQVSLATGFVLGAILASTDPIAVGALARRLHLPPRLLALVQGESLLNDATSLVLFKVSVTVAAAGGGFSAAHASWQFVRLGGGGALVGIGGALLVGQLRSRMDDPVLETVTTLIIPYAIYVGAESIGASGVTAVVLAGLLLGERERGPDLSSGRTRLQIGNVYDVVQFLLESVIFAVIGLQLPTIVRRLSGEDRHFILGATVIVAVVLLVRVLWVYPALYLPYWISRINPRRHRPTSRPSWQVPAVICWVGTRGVVPLAAALSIPLTVPSGGAFPHRDLLLVLTTSCILVTLVGQGLTLEPLVRRLGVAEDPSTHRQDELLARVAATQAALRRLQELTDLEAASEIVATRLRVEFTQRMERGQAAITGSSGSVSNAGDESAYQAILRDLLAAEAAELLRLSDTGVITEAARRRVQRGLDIREAGLDGG